MPHVLVILADGFEEIEAVTPIDLLRRAQAKVTVAGLSGCLVKGSRGITIQAETTLDKTKGSFDACVLPGGSSGAENLAHSQKVKSLILEMHARNKVIAAICAAPALVLYPLGILKNKKATCFQGMEESFDASVLYEKKNVVVDQNIITSRGAGTAFDFGLAIIESLMGKKTADHIAKTTLYKE